MENIKSDLIDENLYSRQLYVLGHDAMHKMNNTNILISGMNGLGCEIAKNIILGGIKNIVLHDTINCSFDDLSSNFYLNKTNIEKNRIIESLHYYKQLNNNVNVSSYDKYLEEEYIKQFSVVVLVDYKIDELIRINNITHKYNIKFISTTSIGLVFQIFNDFCEHSVYDTDGEQIKTGFIQNITQDDKGIITCYEDHNISTDTIIKLNNINGMEELNGNEFEIEYINTKSFRIKKNTVELSTYISGGTFTQVKQSKLLNFKSMSTSLNNPEFMIINYLNFDRHLTLHACWRALDDCNYKTTNLYQYAKKYYEDINENDVNKFIHCVNGKLSPIDSICGGFVAQEIIKACSGKYTPIYQWLYYDAFECLPPNYENLDILLENTRYDGQIKIFGNEFQQKLALQTYFVVGAGAIGCELLKNMAQIGLGNIIVTDMDIIEKSNLSRQFLFRNSDIGKLKAEVASNAIKHMNPDIKIYFHEHKVCPETKHIYNETFFETIDGVANALDNIEARKYVDSLCLLHCKPLLESGTLGTKGNTQVIIPYLTETYSSSADPPEQEIPLCTLKNFPYKIDHTIQWARDVFEGEFYNAPNYAKNYIDNMSYIDKLEQNQKIEIIESIIDVLCNKPTNYNECIIKAYNKWHKYYRDNIYLLLKQFPLDSKTNNGDMFWSGIKKAPNVIDFDVNNDLHIEYVYYMANLYAYMYKINIDNDIKNVQILLSNIKSPNLPIIKQSDNDNNDNNDIINSLLSKLPNVTEVISINSIEFEKDCDTNYHIDFITTAANMRNLNYGINMTNKYETKGIAGKIIPAIATTTSIVAGLSVLELYKLVQKFDDIERYNNNFLNLALPYIGNADPIKCKIDKFNDYKFTIWDKYTIKSQDITDINGATLRNLINYMENKYNFKIDMLTIDNFILYCTFGDKHKMNERLNDTISNIYENQFNKKIIDSIYITMSIEQEIDDENDLMMPPIKYMC
jgi:ubiquitin-activating enzyme E1